MIRDDNIGQLSDKGDKIASTAFAYSRDFHRRSLRQSFRFQIGPPKKQHLASTRWTGRPCPWPPSLYLRFAKSYIPVLMSRSQKQGNIVCRQSEKQPGTAVFLVRPACLLSRWVERNPCHLTSGKATRRQGRHWQR